MCDRTNEFLQLVDRYVKLEITPNKVTKKNVDAPKNKSDFQQAAADIAKGIHHASNTLSKLTKLVRKQGLFDDPTEEINNLIYCIKQDLDGLNAKCDSAQQYVDTKKKQLGEKNQLTSHNMKVVSQLKTGLMNATKDFKSVLEMRTSKMKDQQQKKVQLTGIGTLSPLRQFTVAAAAAATQNQNNAQNQAKIGINGDSASKLPLPQYPQSPYNQLPNPHTQNIQQTKPSDLYSINLDQQQSQAPGTSNLSTGQPQYWQQQLLLAPPATQQYFESREVAVTEVERTIGELGQLFKRLATMISEQQELVERIDEDVESAVSTADKAHTALLKTYESVSSNKGLYVKIIAILTLFLIFFFLFLM